MLADLNTYRFDQSVRLLAEMEPSLAQVTSGVLGDDRQGKPTELSDSRIVAELNHALQTPLRGLRYAIENMAVSQDNALLEEKNERLADMRTALDNCTSALTTFRVLVDKVASVPSRQPSLRNAVRGLIESMPAPSGDQVLADYSELPDRVEGFSNHYLFTMLQPLVENAVEGCAPGGTVELGFTDDGGAVEFTVSNPVDHPVDKEIILAAGRTTKDKGVHEGLGVAIVERLTQFQRGELTADVSDTTVRMRVVLPRR